MGSSKPGESLKMSFKATSTMLINCLPPGKNTLWDRQEQWLSGSKCPGQVASYPPALVHGRGDGPLAFLR